MARVLLVEPDRYIRDFVAGIVADCGHEVRHYADVKDAQDVDGASFDVIVTDQLLGRRSETVAALARRLPVLTLAGRIFCPVTDTYRHPPRLSDKPFRFTDLAALVDAIRGCEPEFALAA